MRLKWELRLDHESAKLVHWPDIDSFSLIREGLPFTEHNLAQLTGPVSLEVHSPKGERLGEITLWPNYQG
jgi:hypothetical protein